MRKFLSFLLAITLTACLSVPMTANESNACFGEAAKVTENSVTTDGILDSLYLYGVKADISRCPAEYENYAPTDGDTYGTAYFIYDSEYLYIYLDVTDKTPYKRPSEAHYWDDDCVEVHIDWNNSASGAPLQYRISSDGTASRDDKADGLDFEAAALAKTDGWYGEMKIKLPDGITTGKKIGVGLMVSNYNGQSGHQELVLEKNSLGTGTNSQASSYDYILLGETMIIPDIAQATVSDIDPQAYTGEKIEPEFEVSGALGEKLELGKDYYVDYFRNVDIGLGYAAINGKGSYKGVKFISYKIVCNHESTGEKIITVPTFSKEGTAAVVCDKCGKTVSVKTLAKTENAFTDIKTDAWYSDAVCYVLAHGLMSGTGKTTFAPDSTTTRAMLVQVLYNVEGKPETDDSDFALGDVSSSDWYYDAVVWAYSNKIVSGTGDTTFSPLSDITREQFAVILRNYANYKGLDSDSEAGLDTYPDKDSVSDYALTALAWATENGIISGSDGYLMPKNGATRAQMASMLMRFLTK